MDFKRIKVSTTVPLGSVDKGREAAGRTGAGKGTIGEPELVAGIALLLDESEL